VKRISGDSNLARQLPAAKDKMAQGDLVNQKNPAICRIFEVDAEVLRTIPIILFCGRWQKYNFRRE